MDFRLRIEGWAETIHRERWERDQSWAEPYDSILEIVVRHATLIDILRLQRAGNPFATELPPEEYSPEVYQYAKQMTLYLQKDYANAGILGRWWIKRKVSKIDRRDLIKGCREYAKRTFGDGIGSSESKKITVSYWSVVTDYFHLLSVEYGISIAEFQNLPYRILMQMTRRILKSHNPDMVFASQSDQLIGEYLERLNNV